MPTVAFVRPLWPVALRSLRILTRLAMTALVLALSVGGAAATAGPSAPAPHAQPPVVRVDDRRPAPRPAAAGHADHAGQPHDPTAVVVEQPTESAVVAVRPAAPATAPVRGPLGVRGPPHA